MRLRHVVAVAATLMLVVGTISALGAGHGRGQVIHSVSGAGDVVEGWLGSYLFSAVLRADGTADGQVRFVDELGVTEGKVTHMRVVGNKATVFAELPKGFECPICGPGVHPTHFFFVVEEGTGGRPDKVGWPLYWSDWGPNWTLQDVMALTPKEFIAWEESWGFFDPPLLRFDGHLLVR